jgi:septum formation protein
VIRFILASASPARHKTLIAAGIRPDVMVSDVDESAVQAPTPAELTRALAVAKASTVAGRVDGEALVLGCDSLLELDDGRPYGKPSSREHAGQYWQRMRGSTGHLHTGHCLIKTSTGHAVAEVATTQLRFGSPSDAEIATYLDTGEPLGVAGAFTIDGFGGWFVDEVAGDPHNVVGLSLPLLRRMLAEHGHTLSDIGYPTR